MPKFNVSLDLVVPVLIEVEADNEEAALDKVCEMPRAELFKHADTEEDSLDVNTESLQVSLGRP